MTRDERLRTVRLNGSFKSHVGLMDLATQFEATAHECDSSAHEVGAMALRWAADRIGELERANRDAQRRLREVFVE